MKVFLLNGTNGGKEREGDPESAENSGRGISD